MPIYKYMARVLIALAAFSGLMGLAHAQNLVWQGNICWQNVSSYDVVRVHFQPTNNSWWDSNMTVNGQTVGSVGNGSSYAGSREVSGSGISLGWVRVGCGGPFGICASYRPSIDYNQCNPIFEDTGISPTEGYFWFEGAKYVQKALSTLSVSKSANPPYLAVGATGQSYSITVGVNNGPTTQPIYLSDALPTGITTSGQITASGGGYVYGCPGVGSTNLSGCYIATGAAGSVTIHVPISIADAATSHNNFNITNTAYASGGGSSNCSSSNCSGSTTNPILNAVDDADSKPTGVVSSTTVSVNDAYPSGSTFQATGGTCTNPSPLAPGSNTTGVLSYTVPSGSQSCTVNYQLCAPAPYSSVCDTATLTVTGIAPIMPTLTVTQRLLIAAPYVFKPPVTFSYAGNNGWTTQPITSLKENQVYATGPQTLAALNTDTTVQVVQTSPNWDVVNFRCTDSNYKVSGNPPGSLVSNALPSITIPAAAVRASAVITCAMLMGYKN